MDRGLLLNSERHSDVDPVEKLIQINIVTLHPSVGEDKNRSVVLGKMLECMQGYFQMMSRILNRRNMTQYMIYSD